LDGTELLVRDCTGTCRRITDVERGVVDAAAHASRREIVGVQCGGAVAIGEEKDGVADPHRLFVSRGGAVARYLGYRSIGERGDPDGSRASAAIAFPDVVRVHDRHVREPLSVGTER